VCFNPRASPREVRPRDRITTVSRFPLSHLSDAALQRDLAALVAKDRTTTAELLAHLAELDRRRLYRELRYDSLYEYCVGELKFSEDVAKKRIRAARTARHYPGILAALADGRLSLTAVLMLSRHLTRRNARELLAAAERRSNAEIEALLAERFPLPDLPTMLVPLVAVPGPSGAARPVPATGWAATACAIEGAARPLPASDSTLLQAVAPESCAPGPDPCSHSSTGASSALVAPALLPPGRLTQLSPHAFELQVTLGRATRDRLVRAQELLAHAVPTGDLATVLDRALQVLVAKLKQRKFGATDRPRAARTEKSHDPRFIAAEVRRAVSRRDGHRCTYVGSGGVRCESRRRLEFDHVVPVAHGGQATVTNLRLRCRAHNQLEAERVFGRERIDAAREQRVQGSAGTA